MQDAPAESFFQGMPQEFVYDESDRAKLEAFSSAARTFPETSRLLADCKTSREYFSVVGVGALPGPPLSPMAQAGCAPTLVCTVLIGLTLTPSCS